MFVIKIIRMRNISRYLFCLFVITYINFYPIRTSAIEPKWIEVPKSRFGQQFWDQNSIHKNVDGSLRVQSKYIATKNEIIEKEIFYTMDINCSKNIFRDVVTSSDEFDDYKNKNLQWYSPKGDKLIKGIINDVCEYGNSL